MEARRFGSCSDPRGRSQQCQGKEADLRHLLKPKSYETRFKKFKKFLLSPEKFKKFRRELLGVKSPVTKFKKFLLRNHFLVMPDYRPLDVLLKKAIMSIENEDLRVLASLNGYDFDVDTFDYFS